MHASSILNDVQSASNFLQSFRRFESIQGYLHPIEGYALQRLAADGQGLGHIVEIGSFCGRSTCWLASGCQQSGREKVVAVDHFQGSPEHQEGGAFASEHIVKDGSTFEQFKRNIEAMQLQDWVTPIQASSAEAAHGWTEPIRLLFIDGDHSKEASRRDFELWSPWICARGYVAFHDIDAWKGVTEFYRELQQQTDRFSEILRVNSLRVMQRVDDA